jgi:hypothetical protein
MAHSNPVNLPASGKYVKLYVDWTAASTRANILTGSKSGNVDGEALATSMGKIAKWYTDFKVLTFTDLTTASSGSGNAVTALSYDNATGKLTFTKGSTFLTQHPTISTDTDTTSTAAPTHGGTFTAIDSVTRDTNGHVTKVNTKTITLPADSNTDTKVTQSAATTTTNYRPLVLGEQNSTNVSTLADTVTGQVYTTTNIYAQPSTGKVYATEFIGKLSRSTGGSWINARDNTAVLNGGTNGNGSFFPIGFAKTNDGGWGIGAIANTNVFYLSYTTDANYASNTNTSTYTIEFPKASGTVALTNHTHDSLTTFLVTNNTNLTITPSNNAFGYVSGQTRDAWNFQQTDGTLISQYYNTLWQTEIFMDYRTGQMSTRGKNNGTWQSWRIQLDSGNWSTYCAAASHTHSNYLGAVNANGYYGMAKPDGTDTDWIRTTTLGIIPYQSGGAGSGHQSLGTSTWYFANAWIDTVHGSLSGNASTATTLKTARSIALGTDFQGSATFDGSANITIGGRLYYSQSDGGNKANYPWHRIAMTSGRSGQYTDVDALLLIRRRYDGGGFGILKISLRTNGSGVECGISARWMVRHGFGEGDVVIAEWGNTGDAVYADVFLRCGLYPRAEVVQLLGSRAWTLVTSNEVNNTTTSDKLTSTEVYASIASAAIEIHGKAYTKTANSISAGRVASADAADKLNTNAGDVARPIYFDNGIPVECAIPGSGSWKNAVPFIAAEIGRAFV